MCVVRKENLIIQSSYHVVCDENRSNSIVFLLCMFFIMFGPRRIIIIKMFQCFFPLLYFLMLIKCKIVSLSRCYSCYIYLLRIRQWPRRPGFNIRSNHTKDSKNGT